MGSTTAVDVVVVGSGPAGAAVTRSIKDRAPGSTVLMVERGPALETPTGQNIRSAPPEVRDRIFERLSRSEPGLRGADGESVPLVVPRPGTHVVRFHDIADDEQTDMPGALFAENVGGMGAFWTCAAPRPQGGERIPFIAPDEMSAALDEAERLLRVSTDAYPATAEGDRLARLLADRFDGDGSPVVRMPLAAGPGARPGHPSWSGPREILGSLADPSADSSGFELRAETAAVRILVDGEAVAGVRLRDMRSGREEDVAAKVVVVAADALRTPQLLWASGVRPEALGRYLNDQPQVVAAAFLDLGPTAVGVPGAPPTSGAVDAGDDHPFHGTPGGGQDAITGVWWLPFDDDAGRPFHTQIMQMDASPIAIGSGTVEDARPIVGVGVFAAKDLRAEDRVRFDERDPDPAGLPGIRIDYGLSPTDRERVAAAERLARELLETIGEPIPGGEPVLLPAGSSIHYQGSVRMGPADDGTSVCDPHGEVWGVSGLFVAGNGVIPTATGCNPTLTNVALAVRAGARIAATLSAEGA